MPELETNSVRLARHLRGIGLAAGGDVTSITGNIPQVFEIYWAGLCSACTSPGSTTT